MLKKAVAASGAIAMLSSPVLAAESVRPSMSLATSATSLATPVAAGTRLGGRVERKNDLLGAPLFIAFLGAVVITIGTIIIINNNNNNPTSPG